MPRPPRGALASAPDRRPDVYRRVHSPSASRRLLASPPGENPVFAPPHPGKQQLPKPKDARPERRLRLPHRRAPFSERKCREAGPGSPDSGRRRRPPSPSGCTGLSSTSRCESVRERILWGRLVGDRPSAILAPLGVTRKPHRRARPGLLLWPPAPRPALGLPGLGTSGREPKGSGAKRSPARPPRREHLPIHGPDGGAHTVRGLTGSPRAEGGGGGGRAAPGDGQAAPLRSPGRSEVGEWETGAETRDAPATAAPPPSPLRKRVPASPHPAPRRRRPPLAPPPAGLRFGSRAPSSGALPKTPLPGRLSPRVLRARLPPAFTGARVCACRFAAAPAFPQDSLAFGLLHRGLPGLHTFLYWR